MAVNSLRLLRKEQAFLKFASNSSRRFVIKENEVIKSHTRLHILFNSTILVHYKNSFPIQGQRSSEIKEE